MGVSRTAPPGARQLSHSCIRDVHDLTTTPNQLLADVHDRPVILPSVNYDLWLDPRFRDLATTTVMLKPYDAAQMRR